MRCDPITRKQQQRGHEKSDLDAAAQSDAQAQIHAIFDGLHHCRAVFGSIADHGNHDHTDEEIGPPECRRRRLDRTH